MTVTDHDLRNMVATSLANAEGDYDIDGICYELRAKYDLIGDRPKTRFDELDIGIFWEIVARHKISEEKS